MRVTRGGAWGPAAHGHGAAPPGCAPAPPSGPTTTDAPPAGGQAGRPWSRREGVERRGPYGGCRTEGAERRVSGGGSGRVGVVRTLSRPGSADQLAGVRRVPLARMGLALQPLLHVRVVQLERRALRADPRHLEEVVPGRRRGGGPLQRAAVPPGVVAQSQL